MNNVNPVFQAALEKRKQAEIEAEAKKNNQVIFEFEDVKFLALEDGKEKVFRIRGNPIENKQLPTDAKLVLQSQIVRDDKKGYSKINWKYVLKDGKIVADPNWILTEFYNEVNKRSWVKNPDGVIDPDTGKNGHWNYFYKETSIFKRIESNAKTNEKYPKSFYPSKHVVMNVIDRHDDWCKINKHTKLLVSKNSVMKKVDDKNQPIEINFTETGIPVSVYDKIFEHLVKSKGGWFDVDVVVTKRVEKKDYEVWDASIKQLISEESQKIASEEPYTKEELEYEMYDFDKLYKVASYSKLFKVVGGLFKLCDEEIHTNFYNRLVALVEKEKEELKNSELKNIEKEIEEEFKKEPKQEEVKRSRESKPKEEVKIDYEKIFPAWNKLSDVDKKLITDNFILVEDDVVKWKPDCDPLPCKDEKNCNLFSPSVISMCPYCGMNF